MRDNPAYHEKNKSTPDGVRRIRLPAEASTLCLLHEKTLAGFLVVTCGTTLHITEKTKGHLTVSFCFWRATQDSNLRPTGS